MNKHNSSHFLFILIAYAQVCAVIPCLADATVRCGTGLCADEHEYLNTRVVKTQKACASFLNKRLSSSRVPTVALCFSGGGMRAAILSLGCLQAAQETGLRDCCTYCAGLSGSTWTIAGSTALEGTYDQPGHALQDYRAFLRENLAIKDLKVLITEERAQEFWDYLTHRIMSLNSLTAIELYGYFLTMFLMPKLTDNRFAATLSETHAFVRNGDAPLPIYTAMEASTPARHHVRHSLGEGGSTNAVASKGIEESGEGGYRWVEFTPFEMGIAEDVNTYIPMSSFGNRFYAGVGTGYEKTLGYCLALFGSAFAVNLKDLVLHMSDALLSKINAPYVIKLGVRSLLNDAINELYDAYEDSEFAAISKMRLMAAHIPNYCYGIPKNPLSELTMLTMIDAGIAFNNLPLAPLLNPDRHVDVIIIYDASEHVKEAPALAAAELYAREHTLPFPEIQYEGIERRPISVFKGEDAQTPTIVYMPRFTTEVATEMLDQESCLVDGSCSTLRFRYTPEDFDALLHSAYASFKKAVPVFKRVIGEKKR